MNFCSFFFLFIVISSVLLEAKENIHKKDLYKHDNESNSSNFHKNLSSLKCSTKESLYYELSKNYILYENLEKYDKEQNTKNLDKGINDKRYSEIILKNKNPEDIFESVRKGESYDYKNNMIPECNVISSSKYLLKKTSRMTRFKNKLYKMIFKRNKFWRVISGVITVLGDSAIICQIIMIIGYILKCTLELGTCFELIYCTLITASGGALGAITLLIILIIVIIWLIITWLWSHKDVYYETHEE
ncbi:Plasmodium exported protein (hyp15), unknown function [Plasmodium sp.]|nr:Plasmodium exported protein (hyp15), unknown function [Plasmodium sp.]